MCFTVYILYSFKTEKFYCGQTDNFDLRIERHNSGMVQSTKNGLPWIRIWTCEVTSRGEALRLERKIKNRDISRFLDDLVFDWRQLIEKK